MKDLRSTYCSVERSLLGPWGWDGEIWCISARGAVGSPAEVPNKRLGWSCRAGGMGFLGVCTAGGLNAQGAIICSAPRRQPLPLHVFTKIK